MTSIKNVNSIRESLCTEKEDKLLVLDEQFLSFLQRNRNTFYGISSTDTLAHIAFYAGAYAMIRSLESTKHTHVNKATLVFETLKHIGSFDNVMMELIK